MFNRLIFAAMLMGLFTAAQAQAAAVTATPPILVDTPNGIICGVTNVGTKPIEIAHQIISQDGVVVDQGAPVTVAPGATYNSGGVVSGTINRFVYCRVLGFSSKKVHVTTCLMTATDIINGVGECLAMTTAP